MSGQGVERASGAVGHALCSGLCLLESLRPLLNPFWRTRLEHLWVEWGMMGEMLASQVP